MSSAADRYEQIADRVAVPMTGSEREHMTELLDEPTDDFKALVVALDEDGCQFPKQQAALMLRNTPGVAAKIIEEARYAE